MTTNDKGISSKQKWPQVETKKLWNERLTNKGRRTVKAENQPHTKLVWRLQDKSSKMVSNHREDQIRSVAQSCVTLCDPMNRSTPGLPVHHQLPEFTQTHVHWVSDAIQPSHPMSSPFPPAPNPSQNQSLYQWVNSSNEVAKVLELQF